PGLPDQLKECGGIGSHVGREIGADPADLSAGADQAAIGVPHQLLHCRRAVGLLDSALECLATVVNGRVVGPSAGEVQRILLAIFHLACSPDVADRKSTRLNSSHVAISYAVFCLKKKIQPSQLWMAPIQ